MVFDCNVFVFRMLILFIAVATASGWSPCSFVALSFLPPARVPLESPPAQSIMPFIIDPNPFFQDLLLQPTRPSLFFQSKLFFYNILNMKMLVRPNETFLEQSRP